MARPRETGLFYIEHTLGLANDPAILRLDNEFGKHVGYALYLKTREFIAQSEPEYAIPVSTAKEKKLLQDFLKITPNKLEIFMKISTDSELFSKEQFLMKKLLFCEDIMKTAKRVNGNRVGGRQNLLPKENEAFLHVETNVEMSVENTVESTVESNVETSYMKDEMKDEKIHLIHLEGKGNSSFIFSAQELFNLLPENVKDKGNRLMLNNSISENGEQATRLRILNFMRESEKNPKKKATPQYLNHMLDPANQIDLNRAKCEIQEKRLSLLDLKRKTKPEDWEKLKQATKECAAAKGIKPERMKADNPDFVALMYELTIDDVYLNRKEPITSITQVG